MANVKKSSSALMTRAPVPSCYGDKARHMITTLQSHDNHMTYYMCLERVQQHLQKALIGKQ